MSCRSKSCSGRYPCNRCQAKINGATSGSSDRRSSTQRSSAFRDVPQRNDPSITNTYFNAGPEDGANHGHVKYRDDPDGTTDYLYVRDVEGNEYDT